MKQKITFLFIFLLFFIQMNAQVKEAPDRQRGEGPWTQLIIRGVTLINGNGAPPTGPVDIIVENNRIVRIANVIQVGSSSFTAAHTVKPMIKSNTNIACRMKGRWI